ncbi:isoaspartyl peptidase/L-asparaginase family protein [Halocola ammonii]
MMSTGKFVLAIHGGVGTILKENMIAAKETAYRKTLGEALDAGEKILKKGGKAIDAVEAAIIVLEDSPLFNAGRGSVFTHEGKNEMDASIMDGKTLNAGAVSGVTKIKNPISAAHRIMENSPHIMLAGEGAEKFASTQNLQLMDPSYFYDEERYQQLKIAQQHDQVVLDHSGENESLKGNFENGGKKLGTVGAVALDIHGDLAAATSTGGMTNKQFGRIGDSPIIGAGTYANNKTCAVSGTGHGEYFIRNVVAYDISALMQYKGLSLKEATEFVILDKLKNQQGEGGVVAVDSEGNCTLTFNTEGMYRGVVTSDKPQLVEIYS